MHEKIIFVAPYDGLKNIAVQVMKEMNIHIDTYVGDLGIGIEKTIEAQKNGKRVVISRGGTAKIIKEELDIPVVEIKVTGYDLLRVFNKYKNSQKKIAVIGYENVINGARVIADILGFNIKYLVIEEELEVERKIDSAIDMGIDIVIGDTVSVRAAKKKGIMYELIESGREAIMNSIDEAIKLNEAIERDREKNLRYKTILNFINEGVIAVNKDEEVIIYNEGAEKLLEIPKEKVMYKKVSKVIPNTRIPQVLKSGVTELACIQNIGKATIATNRVPIVLENEIKGAVVTFQDITKIEELEKKIRQELFKKGLIAKRTFEDFKGDSKIINKVIRLSKKYAKSDSTILLRGESGTGKEVLAQAIHNYSDRNKGPFVAINCSAIPSNLLESELFGYVEGAFTGARKGGKKGVFEIAHKGTIFLDEISEMDIKLQARILRVIQEMEVMKIGDDKIIPIDVRIIAATNRNLLNEISNNNFRRDLYYRINVLKIEIPPLKERKEDIQILSKFFLEKYNKKYGKRVNVIDNDTLNMFHNHQWPGNIRELENVIEKIVIVGEKEVLEKDSANIIFNELLDDKEVEYEEDYLKGTLENIERKIARKVLELENYNKTKAAERLGITRVTLNSKLNNV